MNETMLAVRGMCEADLAVVMRIELASYSVPWTETTFRGLLRREDAELIVVEAEAQPAGYAVFWQVLDQAELGNVAVDPQWRRRGVGRRLVREVLERARKRGVRELFLEVRPSNQNARALYEELGFSAVGRRRAYYQAPVEDAVVMRALLGRESREPFNEARR
jgi:ribosomal-protein-alanine N-acetyltransferase